MSPVLKLFEIVDSKPHKVPFSLMVWRAELASNRKNVQYETIPVTFAENAAYFKRFRGRERLWRSLEETKLRTTRNSKTV
ncbi:hypothetical protein BGZ49_010781 [Haplosporangium sp. Z 27]|nr:hypothetical protein BGZ49_010781 [Haplosporangium sp. Z 27]